MPLPLTQDKTFVATDIFNPALAVSWQDWIAAIHEGRFEADRERTLYVGDGYYGINTTNTDPLAKNTGGGPGEFLWPLIFDVGDVMTGYSLMCNPFGVGTMTLTIDSIRLVDNTPFAVTSIGNLGFAYAQDCVITGRTDLVQDGFVYFMRVTSTNVNDFWGAGIVNWQRPPRTN